MAAPKTQIFSSKKKVTDIKKRVSAHERSTNKDNFIFHNFPSDALSQSMEADLSHQSDFTMYFI